MLKRIAKGNMTRGYSVCIVNNDSTEESEIHEEYQYLNLIHDILENGSIDRGRNGMTKSVFGSSMLFSLHDGKIPILTTKRTAWKTCFKELLWFIRGDTSNEKLREQGVHIWDGNGSREFLDSRGLHDNKEGDLGPVYGKQWRSWTAPNGKVIDQLKEVIDTLKKSPDSRRIIVSAWNVGELSEMALMPCHALFQFYVADNKLSCQLYQRSADVFLGVPFNIASYALLTMMVAQVCDLELGDFIWTGGDTHIYSNHYEQVATQLSREIRPFRVPLKIKKGGNILPLAVTVAASVIRFVPEVEDLC